MFFQFRSHSTRASHRLHCPPPSSVSIIWLSLPRITWWVGSALYVGLCIIGYLIVIFPSNIYAASHRISFGGHSIGPRYLLVRLPLQLLLIWWTYWFAVRGQ